MGAGGLTTKAIRPIGLLVFWLATAAIFAQPQGDWTRKQFTSENGLLQNRVHAMDVDEHGDLLIGTEGGLVRFDGEVFRQVGIMEAGGMQPSRVLDIISLADKAFVVRDASCRQYLVKGNTIRPINPEAPARRPTARFSGSGASEQVVVMAMDPDSMLPGKSDWPYGVRMTALSGDEWCMRLESEVLVYKDTALVRRIRVPAGRWSHLFRLKGDLYTLDSLGGGYRVDTERGGYSSVKMLGFPKVPTDGRISWSLRWEASQDRVGIVTGDEFYDVRATSKGDSLVATRLHVELPEDCKIGAVAWLAGGTVIAIGTDTKGLFIYRKNSMRTLTCDAGPNGVNNMYTAQATYGRGGVVTCVQGTVREFTRTGCDERSMPLPPFDDVSIILDHQQRYWYGRSDSLFLFDDATGNERLVRKGIRPQCFLEHDGAMWVGAVDGIYRIAKDSITLMAPVDESDLGSRPRALCFPPGEHLWMATCSGVYRLGARGGWNVVPGLEGVCARTLAVVDNKVFIGTYGSGAFIYDKGKLHPLPQDPQHFLSHVHAFMPDGVGYLWMSTNQGLFRVRRSDLDIWLRDKSAGIYMAYYGKQSGILNPEFNGGCDPPYVRTADGWASFPTMDGLVWFRPEEIPDAYPKEALQLEEVIVDGVPRSVGKEIDIDWQAKDVVIRFSLAYWGDPENAKLEYAIGVLGKEHWLPMSGGQRELHLGSLPSGDLALSIRKVGAMAHGDDHRLTVKFSVPVPFYRSAWFIGLCIAGGVLVFILLLNLNAARLRRKNLALEKKVRYRTAELVEANNVLRHSLEVKEMLVSIISHDIVTPLRFIARVANGSVKKMEPTVSDDLSGTLKDLARASGKLHANAQDLLHWIKRQDGRIEIRLKNVDLQKVVEEVLAMEDERARERRVTLVNNVPMGDKLRLDSDVLTIVLKNLVGNAVTHAAEGRVTVSGMDSDTGYVLTIQDTGVGMGAAALAHARRVQNKGALGAMNHEGERDVQGLGLLIVADLLELMGGGFTIESELGVGTTICITLPHARQPHGTDATSSVDSLT